MMLLLAMIIIGAVIALISGCAGYVIGHTESHDVDEWRAWANDLKEGDEEHTTLPV